MLCPAENEACPGPGRPRGFDADCALASALALFWRQGYEQTSLDELTAAMGISRSSFYACFKSKHGALLAAVERYCDESFRALTDLAAAAADRAAAARAVVGAIAAPDGGRNGCFLANCVTELAPHDPEVEALSRRQLARIEALLARLLSEPAGDRAADAPDGPGAAPRRAGALLSLALGATMLRKAGVAPERLEALLGEADRLISP
ncbi:transcriptional regulator, TetR family [Tistlia consotensis]|uniref:Transcriptional regulator, TetR family n=1 Tax=Tistlia consotensis USBA 355 TaxID=560819 RepID=A0A1Y6BND1_9PROT|nr:TetR/AcrR family transcriptional regulator [Tistlia consotensis]SMF09683.1 transcriptional regulator, TetR family [Tistlia consotensis USBA 355]SNR34317.1 transcriptional regulator, TetR family [Tistlia consotensis]